MFAMFLAVLAFAGLRDAEAAAAPGFTVTASNVSVTDTGSGSSSYTVTSVNGFSGQVGVSCLPPEIDGSLVLPNCNEAEQIVTLKANGSASGEIQFTPPPTVTARNQNGPLHPAGPMAAGAMLLTGLAAARRRRRWSRALTPAILGAALLASIAATGRIGHGGLAMSHGTFGYTLQAVGPHLQTVSVTIKVTVN